MRFVISSTKPDRFWLTKRKRLVSQGSVETLFRWCGQRLHYCTANLLRTIHTKFYQNRLGFVEDVTKTFWCVFRFTVYNYNMSKSQLVWLCRTHQHHGQWLPKFRFIDLIQTCSYIHCEPKTTHQNVLSYLPQNPADCNKIWYSLSWINSRYTCLINVF